MIVKQKGKILSGVDLRGTYKLVQRYMHPENKKRKPDSLLMESGSFIM